LVSIYVQITSYWRWVSSQFTNAYRRYFQRY